MINYQKELDLIIEDISIKQAAGGNKPSLLLHSCCAPCSSYCLKYLRESFDITDRYYNPNISSREEYEKRVKELQRMIDSFNSENQISGAEGQISGAENKSKGIIKFTEGKYEPEKYFEMVRGLEDEPERGKRCYVCYEMRMREAAKYASENGFDYFTTTLSISPLKNATWINEIGKNLEKEYNVKHLPSDFKKKGGYQESIKLSKEYNLYRQNYCGCVFSKREQVEPERNRLT